MMIILKNHVHLDGVPTMLPFSYKLDGKLVYSLKF